MTFVHTRPRARAFRILALATAVLATSIAFVTPAFAAFDATSIISNDNMRAYDSMSKAEVQAFLDAQPGVLKSLETTDYAGVRRPASEIIWSACREWKISPKVMLTMLQKEQSLLTRTQSQLSKNTLSRAIGAGCPNATTNKYPGFGKQMYYGAKLLSMYAEGSTNSFPYKLWTPGTKKPIYDHPTYGTSIVPKNLATYKLYTYNPSVPGNTNFYNIYSRYFGSPFANSRYRPVFRFRSKATGTYLYTASVSERYSLSLKPKTWDYQGAAFSTDSSAPASATKAVYRFYNLKTKKYSFTTSEATKQVRLTSSGKRTWKYGGVAFRVGKGDSAGAIKVYRFRSKKSGHVFLTKSTVTRDGFRTAAKAKIWRYEGVAYYLPRVPSAPTTTTVTP